MLRPGNTHASHGALAVLKRLIKKLKQAYPGALILFRADAGFVVPALYRYLERQEIRYVIGFITNNRVLEKAAALLIPSCTLMAINYPVKTSGGGDQFLVVFQGD